MAISVPAYSQLADDLKADVQQAIRKGVAWLLEQQLANGSWCARLQPSVDATRVALEVFRMAGCEAAAGRAAGFLSSQWTPIGTKGGLGGGSMGPHSSNLDPHARLTAIANSENASEAVVWSCQYQLSDGSFFQDVSLTARLANVLLQTGEAGARSAARRAVRWLVSVQQLSGGLPAFRDLAIWDTAHALDALRGTSAVLPVSPGRLLAAASWLIGKQGASGAWGCTPGYPLVDTDDTAAVLIALGGIAGFSRGKVRGSASRAWRWIDTCPRENGLYPVFWNGRQAWIPSYEVTARVILAGLQWDRPDCFAAKALVRARTGRMWSGRLYRGSFYTTALCISALRQSTPPCALAQEDNEVLITEEATTVEEQASACVTGTMNHELLYPLLRSQQPNGGWIGSPIIRLVGGQWIADDIWASCLAIRALLHATDELDNLDT